MQFGQGSIGFISKKAATGPPFPVNAADNGTSIDPITGRIVLGNDPGDTVAQLLSNREIPLQGFQFQMTSPGSRFLINPSGYYALGDIDGDNTGLTFALDESQPQAAFYDALFGPMLLMDFGTPNMQLGQINGGGLLMDMNFNAGELYLYNGADQLIYAASDYFEIGDVAGTQNGLRFYLNQPTEEMFLGIGSTGYLTANGLTNQVRLNPGNLNAPGVYLDGQNFIAYYGINDGGGGYNAFIYDDTNHVFQIANTNGRLMEIDIGVSGGNWLWGDVDANFGNGNIMRIDNNSNFFSFENSLNNTRLVVNGFGGVTGNFSPVNSITVEGGIITAVS
jgi:hypothetical protein